MTHPQYPGQPGQQQPYPGQQPQPGAQQSYPGHPSQPFPGQQPEGQQAYPGHPSQPFPGQPPQAYPGQQPYPAPSGGFPAQPYPGQPPYPAAGYPPAPYPAPGYGMPPKPNGATAIIAGILAVLGGLLNLIGLIGGIVTLASPGFPLWMALLALVQSFLLAGTLLPGGILLFLRKPAGRMLTIVGSGLAILLAVVSVAMSAAGLWYYSSGFGGMYAGAAFVGLLTVLVPAGATLVLAIVKPTARWCGRAEPGYPR
jgi:hypothetical protein